jgi:hypothetical protein
MVFPDNGGKSHDAAGILCNLALSPRRCQTIAASVGNTRAALRKRFRPETARLSARKTCGFRNVSFRSLQRMRRRFALFSFIVSIA